MARKKNKKYLLSVDGYELRMVQPIQISAKTFKSIMAQLTKKEKETSEEEREYPLVSNVKTSRIEASHVTQTEWIFTVSTTDVYLTELVCDEGYHFA